MNSDYKIFLYFIFLIIFIFIFILLLINKQHFNNTPKTYFLVLEVDFKFFEDYIDSIKKDAIIKISDKDDIEINNFDKFVFFRIIPNNFLEKFNTNSTNLYLLNTEQLSVQERLEPIYNYPKFVKMLDYSYGNLKYYDKKFKPKVLEYQINYNEITPYINLPKTNDICIIGLSEKRKGIVDQLKEKGVNVDIITGWKEERDKKLFTYKIILNISYSDDYKIMEPLRCNRCIFNKMIVISDIKEDIDSYPLKDYIISVEYNEMSDKIIEVLNNYDKYYKQLGLDTLDLEKLPINKDISLY
jgi:hypothetical protein